jgi:hypothetical protein
MMSETIEEIQEQIKAIATQMEKPDLARPVFGTLSEQRRELSVELEYRQAIERGKERQRLEEERLKQKAAEEEIMRVKTLFVSELQKNNDGWQKLITSIRRQIQKSKELQSQMTEALPSVKAEFTHFFREEEIYHWFFLCLWSHEETGRFLTTANQIIFPAIHREIQMKEHVPPLETEEVNDED